MQPDHRLSQAQLDVLARIRDQPDSDAWNLKQAANCSLAELGDLARTGLIDIGTDRLEVDRMHPVITQAGLTALARCAAARPAELSIAAQIERLEEGRDRGCVTAEQFEALKAQILESGR